MSVPTSTTPAPSIDHLAYATAGGGRGEARIEVIPLENVDVVAFMVLALVDYALQQVVVEFIPIVVF